MELGRNREEREGERKVEYRDYIDSAKGIVDIVHDPFFAFRCSERILYDAVAMITNSVCHSERSEGSSRSCGLCQLRFAGLRV